MGGRHSRNKGKAYERKVANAYKAIGFDARRGYQARSGADAADVEVDQLSGYWIECKHYAGGGLAFRAFAQARKAIADAKSDQLPLVHIHEDNGEHLVVMSQGHWFAILRGMKAMQGAKPC